MSGAKKTYKWSEEGTREGRNGRKMNILYKSDEDEDDGDVDEDMDVASWWCEQRKEGKGKGKGKETKEGRIEGKCKSGEKYE